MVSLLRTKVLLLIAMLLLSTSLTGCVGRLVGRGGGGLDMTDRPPENVDPEEYNVLYIGHSFGRKFAESLEEYAHLAGETNHTQYIEFSGGESGSPGLLWDDAEHQANIRAFLDTGEIDVLIMICCSPNSSERSTRTKPSGTSRTMPLRRTPMFASVWPCHGRTSRVSMGTQCESTSCRIGRTSNSFTFHHTRHLAVLENLSEERRCVRIIRVGDGRVHLPCGAMVFGLS